MNYGPFPCFLGFELGRRSVSNFLASAVLGEALRISAMLEAAKFERTSFGRTDEP